ncbi:TadE family type IV pilus minor pilin [Ruania halotolerans]|uniref:TadE family type IV pilus minor pilin n=1 Tax=Ruania halotolerans TaxID=2897773 RepID=UPI001E606D2A|nr:TadE family type IV pilus minor pilin [Ruania halotolerans]UFU07138.1 pilus assembly protein [Ruania halotolerans]
MTGVRALREIPRERGSVTAELAVLLPAVVLILVAVLVAAAIGVAQVRCADAARAGARAAAVGQSQAEVVELAQGVAGPDAVVSVQEDGAWVQVRVVAEVPLGPLGGLLEVSAELSAPVEPGVP